MFMRRASEPEDDYRLLSSRPFAHVIYVYAPTKSMQLESCTKRTIVWRFKKQYHKEKHWLPKIRSCYRKAPGVAADGYVCAVKLSSLDTIRVHNQQI